MPWSSQWEWAGVSLGDIGPKVGFNEVDNGACALAYGLLRRFLTAELAPTKTADTVFAECVLAGYARFDHVRIPRDQMLMKYSKVDKEGCFSIEGDVRALYSIMMDIRVQLVGHSAEFL